MIPARISKYLLQVFLNLLNPFKSSHPSVRPADDNMLPIGEDCTQHNLVGTCRTSAALYASIAHYSSLNLNALADYLY